MDRSIVVVRVGSHLFGVYVESARIVLGLPPITPLPKAPTHLLGVMNHRGSVVPIIDLGRRLALASDGGSKVFVVETQLGLAGLLVDDVLEVAEPLPAIEDAAWVELNGPVEDVVRVRLSHLGPDTKVDESLIVVLDLAALLAANLAA